MKFPPINLWSKPRQPSLEDKYRMLDTAVKYACCEETFFYLKEMRDEINFVYYCRTGRFLDEDGK